MERKGRSLRNGLTSARSIWVQWCLKSLSTHWYVWLLSGLVQWWRYCSVPQQSPAKLLYFKIKPFSHLSIYQIASYADYGGYRASLSWERQQKRGEEISGVKWLGLYGTTPLWAKQPVFSEAFLLHHMFWISHWPNCLLLLVSSVDHLFLEQQCPNLERLLQLGFHYFSVSHFFHLFNVLH